MISKKVTRYYAECGKGFWKKDAALNHETVCKCWKNPKNKTCKTCTYGKYLNYEHDTGDGGYYECHNYKYGDGEHTGGPEGTNYISVNCSYYEFG